MRFIIGGGGTGGHIFPALAIAGELQKLGHQVSYIGNRDSLEENLVSGKGIPFHPIKVQKLYRKLTLKHFRFPYLLCKSVHDCIRIIRTTDVSAVICTGGYISGPIAIAALLLKRPLFFWDGNSFPGLTTRLLARRMKAIFVAYESTKTRLKGANAINTWIPVRDEFAKRQAWDPAKYGLTGARPIILLTGGSQGSMALNQAFDQAVPTLLKDGFEILWQTGKSQIKLYQKKYSNTPGIYCFDFSNEMPALFQNADLAITRAGAMTIAELQAARLPAILIPLPTAAENHQYYNALEQDRKGVAKLLQQKDLSPEALLDLIKIMHQHRDEYLSIFDAISVNHAANEIANLILGQVDPKEL